MSHDEHSTPVPPVASVQAYTDWNGRTPTAEELREYHDEARRDRRVRDLDDRRQANSEGKADAG